MKHLVFSFFEKIFCIVMVFACCQIPAFIDQYMMRLSSHEAESRIVIGKIKKNAALVNKTVESYIEPFARSENVDVRSFGEMMQGFIQRNIWLEQASKRLTEAGVFSRPFVLMSCIDSEIVHETVSGFHVQIAFTFETLIYAFTGLMTAMLIAWLIRQLLAKKRPVST